MLYVNNPYELKRSDLRLRKRANEYGGVTGYIVNGAFKGKSLLESIGMYII